MPKIFHVNPQTTLFAPSQYPRSNAECEAMGLTGRRNEEIRALTIAAFRVAQNNEQLSTRAMNRVLLLHLVADSTTALNHWISKARLSQSAAGYQLTPTGLMECQNTLLGLAGNYNSTEEKVQEWVARLLQGDHVATRARDFASTMWAAQ
jgi:hypothetical protein